MKPLVFVTRAIPEEGLTLLRKQCDVQVYRGKGVIPRRLLLKNIKHCDALISLLTDKIDADILKAAPHLKVIANYAVGFDNIDLTAATTKKIVVTNTPGALEHAVAEHTFALMMAVTRRLVEADQFMRAGKYHAWNPSLFLGMELQGKTLGIVGLGRIGKGVAQRAVKGMGMSCIYYDVLRDLDFERTYGARFVSLNSLLRTADVVSVHVPLLPSTRHLIGKKELRQMKPTAYLINTSRGQVLDEKALVLALRKKWIAGAGLDVFEFEPKLAVGLGRLKNVVLTPHIASATIEARTAMAVIAAKNMLAVLHGKRAPNVVNKEVYDDYVY